VPPEAIRFPAGLNLAVETQLLWPKKLFTNFFVEVCVKLSYVEELHGFVI
jgi:hypothetical protein